MTGQNREENAKAEIRRAEQARGLVADAQAFLTVARSLLDTLPR
jgi:hypothetical protein